MLIGISGHAGVGKDTLADYICDHFDFDSIAFAGPLKTACAALFGVPRSWFNDREVKEKVIGAWNMSPRQMAQFVGTELVRNHLGKDFWIRRFAMSHSEHQNIVISDLRFQNEAEYILSQGGYIIHLTRPGCDGNIGIANHESENSLQLSQLPNQERIFHYENVGTKDQMYDYFDQLFSQIR
jgi:hypothetical protein